MARYRQTFYGLIVAVVLLQTAAPSHAQTFQGFKLPVYFQRAELEKGQTNLLKTLVTGRSATNLPNGWMFVDQPRIDHFLPSGGTNAVATSVACFLDPKQRVVFSTNSLV